MIVRLKPGSDPDAVQRELAQRGLWVRRFEGTSGVTLTIEPSSRRVSAEELRAIDGVLDVAAPRSPHPRLDAQPRELTLRGVVSQEPLLIAGPCAVESAEQVEAVAARVAAAGGQLLRGGAFKPRTSPYAFRGHGVRALGWLADAARKHQLACVTELMSEEDAAAVGEVADWIQIGCRNMQSYSLLAAAAKLGRPILLKRAMSASLEEWLLAGEHCLVHGAPQVVFCERGIRSFDPSTRNLFDISAIALLSQVYRQPVIADPSHAAGRRDLIPALSRAALAAGAAGLLLETHDTPGAALSDGPQALLPHEFASLTAELGWASRPIAPRAGERPAPAPRVLESLP
ncbi:MAG: 3-deoxy-7-phosphoheptulonate synthase [Polyangiaceae bacterium]|nr:3-deoxy-7-phosphoheptulonate synthase [Polyangiaceae bacterium]MCW5790373.1 3-deoxy-7-phosphoheptulonate synthase [Polyangiaceae bacterium]